MNRLLSIDPGVHHFGLALWHDGELERAWFAEDKIVDLDGLYINEIICERPQVYLSNLKAANDMVALGIAAGELVGKIQADADSKVIYVFPSAWKGSVSKPDQKKGWMPEDYLIYPRVRAVLTSDEFSRIEFPKNKKHQLDVVDAVGLGLFHLNRVGRGCVVKGKP